MEECGSDLSANPSSKPLNGFLNKISEISLVKGLKYPGTLSKRRWFLYSEDVCKLFYYKQKDDVEPLGVINIANCSFSYDLESGNDRLFSIRSDGKEVLLEAASPQERLYWLQQLQNARKEYNLKLNSYTDSSKMNRVSLAKPECGLIQDNEELPVIERDPIKDMIKPFARPEPLPVDDNASARSSLPILGSLPLNFFKNNAVPSSTLSSPANSDKLSPISPSQESRSLDRFSRKLRTSLRFRPSRSNEPNASYIEEEDNACLSCQKLQEKLNLFEEENCNLKDSCQAYKEVAETLQKRIGGLESQNITLEGLNKENLSDGDIIGILREKDNKIVDLELSRQKLMNTLHKLTSDLRDSRMHAEKLEDKLSMVTSLVEAKDKAILSLTSGLRSDPSDIMASKDNRNSLSFYKPETVSIGSQTSYSEYESLKDMLEGYRNQNTFLNKEILDLHTLQEHHKERENRLISESSDWEAKFYQIQSKYLLLLNDLHSPQSANQDSDVISQLLHDLVESSGTTDLRGIRKQGKEYDEYGFCLTAPTEFDINAKASFLQKKSRALASQAEHSAAAASLERKWESFLASNSAKDILHHPELKYLIRQGIPYQYKGKVWSLLIHFHVSKYKDGLPSNYYQSLLVERTSCVTTNAVVKQIEIDLLRTLPNNWHYQTLNSDGIPRLRRVLLAYSRRNVDVGYCQGLNRLAAIALLFLKEEDAFWCLVYIIECLMPPKFYGKNLLGSQVDQRVMKDLIAIKLPLLSSHFEQYGLDVSLFTFNWFICVFIDVIPPSIYLYIWDCFLYEGTKVLFRFALAIFKLCEESITTKRDYLAIVDYLRSVPEPVLDVHKLHNAAFRWANPLSMRYIRGRRDYHRVIVEAELDQVEAVRKLFKEDAQKRAQELKDRSEDPSLIDQEDDEDEHWEIIGMDPPTLKKKDLTPPDKDCEEPRQADPTPGESEEGSRCSPKGAMEQEGGPCPPSLFSGEKNHNVEIRRSDRTLGEAEPEDCPDLTCLRKDSQLTCSSNEESESLTCHTKGQSESLTSPTNEKSENLTFRTKGESESLTSRSNEESESLTCFSKGESGNLTCRTKGKSENLTSRSNERSESLTCRINEEPENLTSLTKGELDLTCPRRGSIDLIYNCRKENEENGNLPESDPGLTDELCQKSLRS